MSPLPIKALLKKFQCTFPVSIQSAVGQNPLWLRAARTHLDAQAAGVKSAQKLFCISDYSIHYVMDLRQLPVID